MLQAMIKLQKNKESRYHCRICFRDSQNP